MVEWKNILITQKKDMDIKNNKYSIFNSDELTGLDLSKITSNIRYSIDGSKFIVEWIDTPENEYITHDEALKLMATDEWVEKIDLEINF